MTKGNGHALMADISIIASKVAAGKKLDPTEEAIWINFFKQLRPAFHLPTPKGAVKCTGVVIMKLMIGV